MFGLRAPKPSSAYSKAPPCSNISCGRVLEIEDTSQRCPRCKSCYCSRGCRRSDAKKHQRICKQLSAGVVPPANFEVQSSRQSVPASTSWSPPEGLEMPISAPFTRLESRDWLKIRPQKDVYGILIDAYRLRMYDDVRLGKEIDPDSVYGGHPTGIPAFRHFLDLAYSRDGLMPFWWNDWRRAACEEIALATDEPKWHRLCAKLDEALVVEHYADPTFPAQLRIFAQSVYGTKHGERYWERICKNMVYFEGVMGRFSDE